VSRANARTCLLVVYLIEKTSCIQKGIRAPACGRTACELKGNGLCILVAFSCERCWCLLWLVPEEYWGGDAGVEPGGASCGDRGGGAGRPGDAAVAPEAKIHDASAAAPLGPARELPIPSCPSTLATADNPRTANILMGHLLQEIHASSHQYLPSCIFIPEEWSLLCAVECRKLKKHWGVRLPDAMLALCASETLRLWCVGCADPVAWERRGGPPHPAAAPGHDVQRMPERRARTAGRRRRHLTSKFPLSLCPRSCPRLLPPHVLLCIACWGLSKEQHGRWEPAERAGTPLLLLG
jgi:hypothetical protein